LWPLPTKPENGGRVVSTVTNDPPKPGSAEPLEPQLGLHARSNDQNSQVYGPGKFVVTQAEMLEHDSHEACSSIESRTPVIKETPDNCDIDLYEPKPPKVLMENPNATPLELRSQIQLYATTEYVLLSVIASMHLGLLTFI